MKKMERTQAIAEKVDKRKGIKVAEEEEDIGEPDVDIPSESKGKNEDADGQRNDDEELDEDEVWKVRLVARH
jgi:hypothetical protein